MVTTVIAILALLALALRALLSEDLDPKSSKSVLGAALQTLRDFLNPKNTESIQNVLDQAVNKATADNGVLAKAVKMQVEDVLKPLLAEIDGLAKRDSRTRSRYRGARTNDVKGISFEEEVTETLHAWARAVGAEVDHVGGDNQPGDVLVTLRGDDIVAGPMLIVIEARDRGSRPMGRKAISADMAVKIAQRNANAGIYVSRTLDGLSAREIGEWAEGVCDYGPWVACTQQHLTTAVRFLIVQRRLAALRAVLRLLCSGLTQHAPVAARLFRCHTFYGRRWRSAVCGRRNADASFRLIASDNFFGNSGARPDQHQQCCCNDKDDSSYPDQTAA